MAGNSWTGASAIVTGAASGIGLELSRALVARGTEVWLTDVDEAGVKSAADGLGPLAHASALDVRDAAAVRDCVDGVFEQKGRLDYLFNNAGIAVPGEAHAMGVEHFDRTIDINIRGVTNGVAAAYPKMVEQGRGHIVNTASAAGLLPVPLATAYAMSKHAVVGLSKSLRLEAERYGVKVSVLCPTAIETPLLDTQGPGDLEKMWRPDLRRFLTAVGGPPYPVEAFVEEALVGVAANREAVISPASARQGAFLYRLFPSLVARRARAALDVELAHRT